MRHHERHGRHSSAGGQGSTGLTSTHARGGVIGAHIRVSISLHQPRPGRLRRAPSRDPDGGTRVNPYSAQPAYGYLLPRTFDLVRLFAFSASSTTPRYRYRRLVKSRALGANAARSAW